MNVNESRHNPTPEHVVELGRASVETKGGTMDTEGVGGAPAPGISED